MNAHRPLTLVLSTLAILLVSVAALAQPGEARPGWTLAAGTQLTHLKLDDPPADSFSNTNTGFYEYGAGGFLQVGYAFSRAFELQLRLAATEHSTAQSPETFSFYRVQMDALVALKTTGTVRPYLAGGLGSGGIVFRRDDRNADGLTGSTVEMGGGTEVFLSRRWSLGLDYRFGVQRYRTEVVEIDGATAESDVDVSSRSHTLQARATFSF